MAAVLGRSYRALIGKALKQVWAAALLRTEVSPIGARLRLPTDPSWSSRSMLSKSATMAADAGRRAFSSALPMLLALPVDVAARTPDSVLQAIATAQEARNKFTAALEALDDAERDKAAIIAAGEAADRDTQARRALAETRPVTSAGLHALIRHHAEDVGLLEPRTTDAEALQALASALPPPPDPEPSRSLASRLIAIVGETIILVLFYGRDRGPLKDPPPHLTCRPTGRIPFIPRLLQAPEAPVMATTSRALIIEHVPFHADPILTAIDHHDEAWAVWQCASEDLVARQHVEMEGALARLLATPCATQFGALALLRHLRWHIQHDGITDAAVLARASDLALTCASTSQRPNWPVRRSRRPCASSTGWARRWPLSP